MMAILRALWWVLGLRFKSRVRIEAENLALRHRLNVVCRSAPRRVWLRISDRLFLVWLHRMWPRVLKSTVIVRPDTVVRRHRWGFKAFWRWKSRSYPGRPRIPGEVRDLIHEVSLANPLWGALRIHGELLKLGIEVAQTTVAKYMAQGRPPTFAILEGIPPKPRRGHCFDRLRRCSDGDVQTAVRAAHHRP